MSEAVDSDAAGIISPQRDQLTSVVVDRLCARPGSVFRGRGKEITKDAVDQLMGALAADLLQGRARQLRRVLRPALQSLADTKISFRDLRLLHEALRDTVLSALEASVPVAAIRAVEDWFHDLTQQNSLYLISQREEMIERQASEIEMQLAEQRQLSIPIVPIYEGVLLVPLVGRLDSYRAQLFTTRILEAVSRTRTQLLLLDVSGVPGVDTDVARHLMRATQAVRLLGSQVILVGISPESAQIMTRLGIDLKGLITRRDLKEGLTYGMAQLGVRLHST